MVNNDASFNSRRENSNSFSLLIKEPDFPKITSQEHSPKSDMFGLFLFALSNTLYGINAFQVKHMRIAFPNEYDGLLLGFWRGIAIWLISYLIMIKKGMKVLDVSSLNFNAQFWLGVRTIGQFLAYVTYLAALLYLRVATANCISSMNPIIVLIFSAFILKEKFHSRYLFGILICFAGTLMIILNDRKVPITEEEKIENISVNTGIIIGTFYSVLNLTLIALLNVSSKMLVKEKIGFEHQCYYLGLSNALLSIITFFFFSEISILNTTIAYTLLSLGNGVIFFIATQCLIESLKCVNLNKTTPLSYMSTMTVMILGVIVLGEPIFFTDILGSMCILGFNVYNSFYPPQ
jgi:drug/metabolite transporter (DMT)-like permease